jgi:hypothetical protein
MAFLLCHRYLIIHKSPTQIPSSVVLSLISPLQEEEAQVLREQDIQALQVLLEAVQALQVLLGVAQEPLALLALLALRVILEAQALQEPQVLSVLQEPLVPQVIQVLLAQQVILELLVQ